MGEAPLFVVLKNIKHETIAFPFRAVEQARVYTESLPKNVNLTSFNVLPAEGKYQTEVDIKIGRPDANGEPTIRVRRGGSSFQEEFQTVVFGRERSIPFSILWEGKSISATVVRSEQIPPGVHKIGMRPPIVEIGETRQPLETADQGQILHVRKTSKPEYPPLTNLPYVWDTRGTKSCPSRIRWDRERGLIIAPQGGTITLTIAPEVLVFLGRIRIPVVQYINDESTDFITERRRGDITWEIPLARQ